MSKKKRIKTRKTIEKPKEYDYQSYQKNRKNEREQTKGKTSKVKNKNRDRNRKIRITSLVVTAFILIYIPSVFNWIYSDNVSTGIIYNGKIEDSNNIDVLIIRDEVLLDSTFDGRYIPIVEEGEKVAVNSIIATILKESSSNLLIEVGEINKKIISAQKDKNKLSEIFSQDIDKLNNEIAGKVNLLISEVNDNRLDNIKKLKVEIDEIIQRKALIIGNEQNDNIYIKTLKEQKTKLEKQMAASIEEKKTTFSGVVSYNIDGYENILNYGSIKDITPQIFKDILSDNTEEKEKDKENRKATSGKPFAKVTKSLGCHLVFIDNLSDKDFLKEGKSVNIRINDINRSLIGVVDYISQEQSGKHVIAVNIDKYTDDISAMRILNVDIIKSTYQGLMVPLRSLLDINLKDNTANLIIIKANYASIRKVEIKGVNNEYAVITSKDPKQGISLYDTYIINPKNIHDGQVISQ